MNFFLKVIILASVFYLNDHSAYSQITKARNKVVKTKPGDSVIIKQNSEGYQALTRRPDSIYVDDPYKITGLLNDVEFISANVYFSGTGFYETAQIHFSGTGCCALTSYFKKCEKGSRVTFENCVIRNSDRTKSIRVSKSFFIQ